MVTVKNEIHFRHDNDCKMSGCPGHFMTAEHQTTSDYFTVKVDGVIIYSGDDNTTRSLINIIEMVDYANHTNYKTQEEV